MSVRLSISVIFKAKYQGPPYTATKEISILAAITWGYFHLVVVSGVICLELKDFIPGCSILCNREKKWPSRKNPTENKPL